MNSAATGLNYIRRNPSITLTMSFSRGYRSHMSRPPYRLQSYDNVTTKAACRHPVFLCQNCLKPGFALTDGFDQKKSRSLKKKKKKEKKKEEEGKKAQNNTLEKT